MRGVALKVNFNDGGSRSRFFGYNGVCKNQTMLMNVRERKVTVCNDEDSRCRQFVDKNFTGRRPSGVVCYESVLFDGRLFEFGAGYYHNGKKAGEPISVRSVKQGDIAFLTTIPPGGNGREIERVIFGCYRIGVDPYIKDGWGYMFRSDGSMDVRLPDNAALQTSFWRHYQNKDGSFLWGTRLDRHLNTEQTRSALSEILVLLGDSEEKQILISALGDELDLNLLKPKAKPNTGGGPWGGEGGESDAHKLLKEYVAKNPKSIGLPKSATSHIEHGFLSGDRVDIVFDLTKDQSVVVEIETIIPLPGAHQCVKYRALREAELGLELGSGAVRAILVAHHFDEETKIFAKRYGIKCVQLVPEVIAGPTSDRK